MTNGDKVAIKHPCFKTMTFGTITRVFNGGRFENEYEVLVDGEIETRCFLEHYLVPIYNGGK